MANPGTPRKSSCYAKILKAYRDLSLVIFITVGEVCLQHISTGPEVKVLKSIVPGDISTALNQNGNINVVQILHLLAHFLIWARDKNVVDAMDAKAYALMLMEQYNPDTSAIEFNPELLETIRQL